MDITIKKSELSHALSKVQGIVEKKNTVPILSCVLFEVGGKELFVTATDLEVSLRSSYKVNVSKEGTLTAPAKKIFEIVRELPEGEVRISSEEGGWVRVEMDRARFRMMSLPTDDFPAVPRIQEGERIDFSGEVLGEMIDKTSFAMSSDLTRHALNGVLLEVSQIGKGEAECRMVATDGHRLAYVRRVCRGEIEERKGVIVPRKAVMELRRIVGDGNGQMVEVYIKDNRMAFKVSENVMVTRLVEGQFPDYQQVMPDTNTRKALVDREKFYRAVRRVSTLSAERANPLRFSFHKDGVTVTSVNPEVGDATEDLEVEYQGEDLEIGLNSRYIMDVFSVLSQDQISIEMNEELSPTLLRPVGDEDYGCVVMPMRL
jgi:DNA polymerase-3 subunit beta